MGVAVPKRVNEEQHVPISMRLLILVMLGGVL